jgi:hypothetical protein
MKTIVGIDIGYHNLGLVQVSLNETFEPSVHYVKRINITNIKCLRAQCKIPHTNEVADLMGHFIQEYGHLLDSADTILLERQPPGGLTSIETLLLYLYRPKTELISPNSMHKHFGIGFLSYESRKIETERITQKYFKNFLNYENQVRKHDMADAMCLILYYTHKDREKYRLKNIQPVVSFDQYLLDAKFLKA